MCVHTKVRFGIIIHDAHTHSAAVIITGGNMYDFKVNSEDELN